MILFDAQGENTFNLQTGPVGPGTMKRRRGKKQLAVFTDGIRQSISTDEAAASPYPDWWEISGLNANTKERVGHPTEKPLVLLHRIIAASTNPGGAVLGPFSGCATTCITAELAGERNWTGIDVSPKGAELAPKRLEREVGVMRKGHGPNRHPPAH